MTNALVNRGLSMFHIPAILDRDLIFTLGVNLDAHFLAKGDGYGIISFFYLNIRYLYMDGQIWASDKGHSFH